MIKADKYYNSKLASEENLSKPNQLKYKGDIVDLMQQVNIINLKVQ